MLKKLKQALGKIVKKIKSFFNKKENKNFEIKLAPGAWYINGTECNVKFTSLENSSFETTDFPAQLKRDLKWEADLGELDLLNEKELEKMLNTSLTDLPNTYWIKTLIVSIYPNWQWEGSAVDMSRYSEEGIAHYMVFTPDSAEEVMENYRKEYGTEPIEMDEDGIHVCYNDAVLLEYGDGTWDYI